MQEGKTLQASSLCRRAAEGTAQVIYSHKKEPEVFGIVERKRLNLQRNCSFSYSRFRARVRNNLDPASNHIHCRTERLG